MIRNGQEDLNNFLFAELERLNDPDLKEDELRTEMSRADSVAKTAMAIISNWDLSVKVAKAQASAVGIVDVPPMLGGGKDDKKGK